MSREEKAITGLRDAAALLVDLDNTLYDFDGAYLQATRRMALEVARHGPDAQEVEARHLQLRDSPMPAGARSGREVRLLRMRQLLDSFPETREVDAAALVDLLERQLLQGVCLFPGARAVLEKLRSQAPLLVVTEGWADVQHGIMHALGLPPEEWRSFPTLSLGVTKSDGSGYALALEQLGVRPEQAVMVGDNWNWDVLAPARLGVPQVWISRGRMAPTAPPQRFLGAIVEIGELAAWLGEPAPPRSFSLPAETAGHNLRLYAPSTQGEGLAAELRLESPDWRQVPRGAPQPWAEVLAPKAGGNHLPAEGMCRALLSEMGRQGLPELVVVAPPAAHAVVEELRRRAPGDGLGVSFVWPPMAPPAAAGSPLVLHLYRNGKDPRVNGAFRRSYDQELEATEADPTTSALFQRLTAEVEGIVREEVGGEFGRTYGTQAVMVVGSSLRGTYAALPADIDVIVLTHATHDQFNQEELQAVLRGIIARIEASPTFASYCDLAGLGRPAAARRLEMNFLGLRGAGSMVARFDACWGPTRAERSLFLDISLGRIPRPLGYGLSMRRYLDELPEKERTRLRREIRLVKRLFKSAGGLYDSPERGLRGHTIEQWLIQARAYRSSGLETGTVDNLLHFIAEECAAGPGASELMDFQEFKRRFPVWHPGVWETQVVPPGTAPINLLDYLGDNEATLAQEKWSRLVRLARTYVRWQAEDRAWTLCELGATGRKDEGGTP